MRKDNPFNQFLFSYPGKHGKFTLDEVKKIKGNKNKSLEVIDVQSNKRLGKMSVLDALLKFS
jgi:hypothetical protein